MVIRPFQWEPKHHGHIKNCDENGLMTIPQKLGNLPKLPQEFCPKYVIFPVSGEQIGCCSTISP
jgi:hypothetical protein